MAEALTILSGAELNSLFAGLELQAARLDLTQPLSQIAIYLAASARQCFAESRAPDGTPWAPLRNPSKRRGLNPKPLIDTGKMLGSVYGRVAESAVISSEAGIVTGVKADYASFHQYGTRKMVARPSLGVTDAMRARMRQMVVTWLSAQTRA